MTTMIFLCVLIGGGSFVLGGTLGYKWGFNREKHLRLQSHSCRRGIIHRTYVGAGTTNKGHEVHCTFLVTELENLGNKYSRIKIDEVTGVSDEFARKQVCGLLGNVVSHDIIEWSDPLAPLE